MKAPSNRSVEYQATWKQVAGFRLGRHHLLARAPGGGLEAAAGEMGGVQAQLISAAQIGLWARVESLRIQDIDQALGERRLVKAACMRQTQFWVPAEDLAVFVRGSARRAAKAVRWTLGKGVAKRTIDAAAEAALAALDQPRTRPEIAERVSRALGVQARAMQGGVGWGSRREVAAVPVGEIDFPVVYLMQLAAARGVICSGPNRGNEPTFVRADAWIPAWRDVGVEEAETRLLRVYLRAFGPATVEDYAVWCGITLGEARAIWAREAAGIARVEVEGWTAEMLREDLDELARAGVEQAPVRLLPFFDTFLIGHRQREHLAERQQHGLIYKPQGWIAPVVLVEGRAVGVWEQRVKGQSLQVKVSGFGPISPDILDGIRAEAQSLSWFLGASSAEVQVE